MLLSIWQRVLHRPAIEIDENFFALGGNLRAADLLFEEIARQSGIVLPSATIYQAQTIAALSLFLDQPAIPPFHQRVKIKTGTDPAIFIVHGLAGTLPFFSLAQHLKSGNAVYGLQGVGVDGLQEPLDRVEDMAALYLDSIRDLQPHGPYLLIGYSFGGLVALEMAQRLTTNGEKVALLALVDAYPHPRYLSLHQSLWLFARRAIDPTLMAQRWTRRTASLGRALKSRPKDLSDWRNSDWRNHHADSAAASSLSFEQTTRRVKNRAYIALARYKPRFYDGKIKFVKSESDSYFPADPRSVWVNLAADFEFQTVRGGHLDMVTTDCEGLASVLTRYVSDAMPNR